MRLWHQSEGHCKYADQEITSKLTAINVAWTCHWKNMYFQFMLHIQIFFMFTLHNSG